MRNQLTAICERIQKDQKVKSKVKKYPGEMSRHFYTKWQSICQQPAATTKQQVVISKEKDGYLYKLHPYYKTLTLTYICKYVKPVDCHLRKDIERQDVGQIQANYTQRPLEGECWPIWGEENGWKQNLETVIYLQGRSITTHGWHFNSTGR